MQELINATEPDIMEIKGIGKIKAGCLFAMLRFAQYVKEAPSDRKTIIRGPEDIYDLVRCDLEYLMVEQFLVIGLNTKHHVIAKHMVSTGTVNASLVHPRETFRLLIRRACAAAILVHNHPSGDSDPSREDIELTRQLVEVGKIIDIPVLDHVIVGQGNYTSLKDRGIIT